MISQIYFTAATFFVAYLEFNHIIIVTPLSNTDGSLRVAMNQEFNPGANKKQGFSQRKFTELLSAMYHTLKCSNIQ
jgi:hypothetical protein